MRIYGRNSISERLKINPQSIQCLFLEKEKAPKDLELQAKNKRIPIRYLSAREFEKASRGIRSQGIVAEVEDFKYSQLENILATPKEKLPTLLFLDNLNDPQNLGAIVRTAACLGGFAVVLPKHNSVEVTEGGQDLTKTSLSFPLGIVIGSEAKGIRQGLTKHLDFSLTIPMLQAKLSLNVATAIAIFCYEIVKQSKAKINNEN